VGWLNCDCPGPAAPTAAAVPHRTATCVCGDEVAYASGRWLHTDGLERRHVGEPTDARERGSLCGSCGDRYTVDFLVPDGVWARVVRPGEELLCGPCITTRVEGLSGFEAYDVTPVPRVPTTPPDGGHAHTDR
ncbi:MAG TPA: hypothetical protein VF576_06450, partial [Rubricoccaceae bacterium]